MLQEKSKEKIHDQPVSLFQLTEYKDNVQNNIMSKTLNDTFRL